MEININEQKSFSPENEKLIKPSNRNSLSDKVEKMLELLLSSRKPIILVGNGVRLANAEEKLYELIKQLNIPVLTTWKALDLFEDDDPLFVGRPGAVGQRAANISQQKSDWLLMLGARMDMGQTAYMHKFLARKAKKIMVDIDEHEINKMETTIDVPITCDADVFIDEMLIHLKNTEINLAGISAIKLSPDELVALTGSNDAAALLTLQKSGIENIILTNKQDISLLIKDKIYSIRLPNMELFDTTGIGDIFCATFCCTLLKERDFLWALSFAGGAAQAALETKKFGVDKIPRKSAIENNGSYFYNMVKFRQI